MPTFLILANRAEYHFFHRLCIYQDRATEHLRPNSRKKNRLVAYAHDFSGLESQTDSTPRLRNIRIVGCIFCQCREVQKSGRILQVLRRWEPLSRTIAEAKWF